MRVVSAPAALEVAPGAAGTVALEVVNPGTVIDELTVQVLGVPPEVVDVTPASVVLFPDAGARLELTFTLPERFPAGTHAVTVHLTGRTPGADVVPLLVELAVPARPAARLSAAPSVVRTRRRATFTVQAANAGNVPLDLALRTLDADRALVATLTPSTLAVPVGGSATSTVAVQAPRMLLGGDRDRTLRVVTDAEGAQADVTLTLRQRPLVGRGAVTALVLLAIVAGWAAAMGLGMRHALGGEPLPKVADASFFAATAGAGGVPDGALPKDGPVPAAVGATVTGAVTSALDGEGVGRLTVDALRTTRDGLVVVSSAATQTDGTYTLAGLFPGPYLLRVQTDGYPPVWYPAAGTQAGARTVTAPAQQVTEGVDLRVTGEPASLSGVVDVGEATRPVPVTVTATAAWADADPALTWTVQADDAGAYRFDGLPAPGGYALTFTADGYTPTTATERVLGAQQRILPPVRLGAGAGVVSGTVTDGVRPLGGVTVTTTVDGEEVRVGTPTVGDVGRFVLPALPTPATYVLTVAREGYAPQTVVVDLAAGEQRTDVLVALTGGVGTVSGRVVDASGAGLGGVRVTAGGSSTAATTTTLTAGDVGAYTLAGLAGGELTLTFAKDGYEPSTVAVPAGQAAAGTTTLRTAVGAVAGRVLRAGAGVAGVTVQATDGLEVRSSTTVQTGGAGPGAYRLDGLRAGRWTVSVLDGTTVVATALVTVGAGGTATQDLVLPGSG